MATCSEPTRSCNRCGHRQPYGEFYVSRIGKSGHPILQSYCKTCDHELTTARQRKRGRTSRAEYYREWRKRRKAEDAEWTATQTAARRARRNGTELHMREVALPTRSGEFLPAAPFAQWLRWVMAADNLNRAELAHNLAMTEETVRRILNGRQDSVDLMTVDAALQRDERRTLHDIYGDAIV